MFSKSICKVQQKIARNELHIISEVFTENDIVVTQSVQNLNIYSSGLGN